VFNRLFGRYETLRKVVVSILGLSVILIGGLMLVLPGPAIIVIPAGLAILATEFGWARMILKRFKRKLGWPAEGKGERETHVKKGRE
jgi:uncharacterized protein (TIGR02611 family)